jgi:hypothetical protein
MIVGTPYFDAVVILHGRHIDYDVLTLAFQNDTVVAAPDRAWADDPGAAPDEQNPSVDALGRVGGGGAADGKSVQLEDCWANHLYGGVTVALQDVGHQACRLIDHIATLDLRGRHSRKSEAKRSQHTYR